MAKPSRPSQPKTSSPESQEGEETQNTSAPDNKAEGEQKGKNGEGNGGGFADFIGNEASLHFSSPSSPEESVEQGEGWRQQAEEWQDKALRAAAEVENTRDRLEKELEKSRKFAAAPLANDIFQVADILNNAIKSLPDTWQDNKELKNFIDGLHMTERSLQAALQKHHIRQIGKIGDKFDAAYHQAVSIGDDKTAEPNTIIEVLQPGYMLHDRILRPAQVIISKPSPPAP